MANFNINMNDLEETGTRLRKEEEIAGFKDTLRKKGILPILKDGKLLIYKISVNKKISELSNDYKKNMYDLYKVIVLYDRKFETALCQSSYLPFFRNMIHYRSSTPEEVYEKFNLDDEQNKKTFMEKYAQELEICIPLDEKVYTKGYRKEEIEEVVQRISHNYVTCTCKRDSKLSAILDFIEIKNYIDLDFIAKVVYEFLYLNKVNFSIGTNIVQKEQMKIDQMQFTDKEKSLSEDEKISLIREIISMFHIECVYCNELDKISDFQLESMMGTKSREIVIEFAEHNNNILNNSDFSVLYNKILYSNPKALKKK